MIVERIILMGRCCERSFVITLQRAETSVIDGAIRDNFAIRIDENLSLNLRWYFMDILYSIYYSMKQLLPMCWQFCVYYK